MRRLTIGTGIAMIIRSIMKSDKENPRPAGNVAMHIVRNVSTEDHNAEKFPLQAKRVIKKKDMVHNIINVIIARLAIPNVLDPPIRKIRRNKKTKLSLTNPKCGTCIKRIAHSS